MNSTVVGPWSRWGVVVAVLSLVLGGVGCSDSETDSHDRRVVYQDDTGVDSEMDADASEGTPSDAVDVPEAPDGDAGDDGGKMDARDISEDGDASGGCPEVSCSPTTVCVDGECVFKGMYKCDNPNDKGAIAPGETVTIQDSFFEYHSDYLTTRCATVDGPEKVYRFTVSSDSYVTAEPSWGGEGSTGNAKMEFRAGGCWESYDERTCYDTDDGRFFAEAGTTYYLVIEEDRGQLADFEVDLTAEAADCEPGAYSCKDAQTLQRCEWSDDAGGTTYQEYNCPAGSCAGGECGGDSCGNPIVVNDSTTVSGSLDGIQASMNFKDNQSCRQDPESDIHTIGPEVVFKLPSLTAGQEVIVDTTNDAAANVWFATKDCRANVDDIVCEEVRADESDKTWSVPSDGTYWLIVDKLTHTSGEFEYTIDVEP